MTWYVIDTNALLWFAYGSSRLSVDAWRVLNNPGDEDRLATSSICMLEAWDITRKNRRGFSDFGLVRQRVIDYGIEIRGLDMTIINLLPDLWEDSHDMVVLATALELEAQHGAAAVISSDENIRFRQHLIPCLW